MELGHLPLGAALVTRVIGALVPVLQYLHRVTVVLDDHKASVGVGAVEAIGVVIGSLGVPGIQGHGEAVFGFDLPVVEHPLERKMLETEGSVGIEKYDELVVFDVLGERRGLNPGSMAVLEFVRVDEFVVVAMDQRVDVVAEDTAGNMVELAPVVDTAVEILGRLERARFQIQDQNILAQLLLVARLRGQRKRGQIEIIGDEGEVWLVGRDRKWLVQLMDDVLNAEFLIAFARHSPAGWRVSVGTAFQLQARTQGETHISTWVLLFGRDGICGGVCHAMKPKMNINMKPAATARPNSGPRGAVVGNILTAGARFEEVVTEERKLALGGRRRASQRRHGASACFKASSQQEIKAWRSASRGDAQPLAF